MTPLHLLAAACGIVLAAGAAAVPADDSAPDDTRTFYMGFQDVTWGDTQEAVDTTYAFLKEHTDIVCVQFNGGIPWEAADKGEYPEEMQQKWRERKERIGDKAIYLEIGPLNSGRTGMGGRGQGRLKSKPFDDPEVLNAYKNFLHKMIEVFEPKYLGVGIEVNELYENTPGLWVSYFEMHKNVYKEMKARYPELPVTTTLTLHRLLAARDRGDQKQLDVMKEMLECTDYAGISYYPFVGDSHDFSAPTKSFDWLKEYLGERPMAFTEVAFPGEDIAWGGELRYAADLEKQKSWVQTLLEVCERDQVLFVIYWAHRDWDARWESAKDTMEEVWTAWRDIGLLAGDGEARPALEVWKQWLQKEVVRPAAATGN